MRRIDQKTKGAIRKKKKNKNVGGKTFTEGRRRTQITSDALHTENADDYLFSSSAFFLFNGRRYNRVRLFDWVATHSRVSPLLVYPFRY